jgi:hypothetical protein
MMKARGARLMAKLPGGGEVRDYKVYKLRWQRNLACFEVTGEKSAGPCLISNEKDGLRGRPTLGFLCQRVELITTCF